MTDYNLFRALEICMNKARKQAIDGGVEMGIMVASAMNIPQEGSTDEMTDEISIERMMTWGKPSESKCDFVRKYVRNHRKEGSPTMAWDAEIVLATIEYRPDPRRCGFTVVIGVLADTTPHGKEISKVACETFNAYKV